MVPFFLPIAQPSKSPKEALPEQSVDAVHGRQKADRDRRPCPGFLQTYKPSPKSIEFPSIQLQQVLPLFSPTLNSGTHFFHLWALSPNKGSCSNLENTASWPQLSSEHGTSTTTVQRFGQGLWRLAWTVCSPTSSDLANTKELGNPKKHGSFDTPTWFFAKITRKIQNASECLTLTYWRTLEILRTWRNDMRQKTYSTESYQ